MLDLTRYRLLIFDADGTLRRCKIPGQPCPNRPDEWELIPGVRERFAEIDWTWRHFGIASNQAGVALGYLTDDAARFMLRDLARAVQGLPPAATDDDRIRDAFGRYGTIAYCPHAPDAGCSCRKPAPGMIDHIRSATFVSDRSTVLFVGDQESDRLCAERAGVAFAWAHDFFDWPTCTKCKGAGSYYRDMSPTTVSCDACAGKGRCPRA